MSAGATIAIKLDCRDAMAKLRLVKMKLGHLQAIAAEREAEQVPAPEPGPAA